MACSGTALLLLAMVAVTQFSQRMDLSDFANERLNEIRSTTFSPQHKISPKSGGETRGLTGTHNLPYASFVHRNNTNTRILQADWFNATSCERLLNMFMHLVTMLQFYHRWSVKLNNGVSPPIWQWQCTHRFCTCCIQFLLRVAFNFSLQAVYRWLTQPRVNN
jgi:hypothetical protein